MATQSLLTSPYALLLAVILITVFLSRQKKRASLPDLPWINRDERKWFSEFRARLTTTINQKDAISYAYNNVRNAGPLMEEDTDM